MFWPSLSWRLALSPTNCNLQRVSWRAGQTKECTPSLYELKQWAIAVFNAAIAQHRVSGNHWQDSDDVCWCMRCSCPALQDTCCRLNLNISHLTSDDHQNKTELHWFAGVWTIWLSENQNKYYPYCSHNTKGWISMGKCLFAINVSEIQIHNKRYNFKSMEV